MVAEGASALGVSIDAEALDRIETWIELLERWNRRINLVGRCTREELVDRHVHDALALLRLLDREEVLEVSGGTWLDVGSGAGLPGLLLAAARPRLSLRLVEPIGKKVAFCREAIHTLGLENVEVHQDRVEALEAGRFRACLSRATFPPEVWAVRGRELVGEEGLVLVTMAAGAPAELVEAGQLVDRLRLPLSGAVRVNVLLGPVPPAP